MPPSLRKAVAAAIGGGAIAIASVLITGPSGDDGLEGVSYIPYKDIVGVWTVCHGHTGKDIMLGKTYTEAECKALLNKDLATVARQINPYIKVDIPETTRGALYSFVYNVGGGHDKLKLYRLTDILTEFMGLPPPVAEGEMDPHERKAWYQSERERLKFEQETAQLIPASDVRREFAIWAKAVVQVLETLPDILERDCGLQPAAVSRVQSIIDDLRDQIALRVTEAGADDEEELQQEE